MEKITIQWIVLAIRPLYNRSQDIHFVFTLRSKCKPKQNIVFIKTHKTGSSTVTSILHRYGDKHNLVFALPPQGQNGLNWPWSMRVDVPEGVQPNIVCHHGRYDRQMLERIMPRDTVYITILRDPVKQFESAFSYYGFNRLLGIHDKGDSFEDFLEKPVKNLVQYVLSENLRNNSQWMKLIRNGMAFDLGLNSTSIDGSPEIDSFLKKLKNEFDLVLIAEFFDQSLLLLQDLLCWPLEDLLYFKLNERKRDKVTTYSATTINNMQRWNNVDFRLYRQFYDILKEKIARITHYDGERFEAGLEKLRAENLRMRELCVRNVTFTPQRGTFLKKEELNRGLNESSRIMCDKMIRSVIDYMQYLRDKQGAH